MIVLEISVRAQVFETDGCEEADGRMARAALPSEAKLSADW